jgi:hypothetical protein
MYISVSIFCSIVLFAHSATQSVRIRLAEACVNLYDIILNDKGLNKPRTSPAKTKLPNNATIPYSYLIMFVRY